MLLSNRDNADQAIRDVKDQDIEQSDNDNAKRQKAIVDSRDIYGVFQLIDRLFFHAVGPSKKVDQMD